MSVYEKLQMVQSKLNVPKGQYNSFGKYSYRSCEDIMEAAKPVLAEVGAALVVGDDLIQIGDRYYVKATARFIDTQDGAELSNTAYARETEDKKGMDASQVTGASSSYARKYALNGLFCLDDVKDADTMDNSTSKSKAKKSAADSGNTVAPDDVKVSPAEVASVKSEIMKYASRGITLEKILGTYKIKSLEEMNMVQYEDCMNKFDLYKQKQEDKK